MAQKQIKTSRVQEALRWFGRHKAAAGFVALIAVVLLYVGGSWAVLQVQIHFERERFERAEIDVESLDQKVNSVVSTSGSTGIITSCNHTDAVWGQPRANFCEINNYDTFDVRDLPDAKSKQQRIIKSLEKGYAINLKEADSTDISNLSTYSIVLSQKELNCFIDFWYFRGSKLPFDLGDLKSVPSQGLLMQVTCSGKAKLGHI